MTTLTTKQTIQKILDKVSKKIEEEFNVKKSETPFISERFLKFEQQIGCPKHCKHQFILSIDEMLEENEGMITSSFLRSFKMKYKDSDVSEHSFSFEIFEEENFVDNQYIFKYKIGLSLR